MNRRKKDWLSQTFDTPEKMAKFHVYFTVAVIISYIMIIIGVILFILIVAGVIDI